MHHSDGERGIARACQAHGTCYIQGHFCSDTIEEVCEASPGGLRWFQMYMFKDKEMSMEVVRLAVKHGYKALVLTIDLPVTGRRLGKLFKKIQLPSHVKMAYTGEGVQCVYDSSMTWDVIPWLKQRTSLPIIVKGVLTAEDAVLAVSHGVAGIIVSNHGGRLLDTSPATIDVLPEVIRAVANQCEVYVDGGVRTGVDVLKALALGARAVFIGRPAIWGLAYNGEAGVTRVLQILKEELDIAMALIGAASIKDLHKDMVVRESFYNSKL